MCRALVDRAGLVVTVPGMKILQPTVLASAIAAALVVSSTAADSTVTNAAAPAKVGEIQIAGELIVNLDARDASAGTATWTNKGSMGNFKGLGQPKLVKIAGQPAVRFNGKTDAYRSEKPTPPEITGAHARSIEVWVFNPALDSSEECLVAWGRRGEALHNLSFNYGSEADYNAVTHYDHDMSWSEIPEAGKWHHLAYTYDGKTAKIFSDGVERGSGEFALETTANAHMNIAVENNEEGEPLFESEWEPNWPLSLSGSIATIRVHSGALTAEQVKANFNVEKERFAETAK